MGLNLSKNVIFRIIAALVALALVVTLVVVTVGALRRPVLLLLGFDLNDYACEEVLYTLPTESDVAAKLTKSLDMLTYSPSGTVTEFEGAEQVAELYTDSILSYLMSLNYSKYVCNLDLLSRAADNYSNYNFRTLIPAADFENEIYRAFGGERAVRGKSGEAFTYHEKIDSFSAIGSVYEKNGRILPVSLGVTEHTYRFTFTHETDAGVSPEFVAIARERSDGTLYIIKVMRG